MQQKVLDMVNKEFLITAQGCLMHASVQYIWILNITNVHKTILTVRPAYVHVHTTWMNRFYLLLTQYRGVVLENLKPFKPSYNASLDRFKCLWLQTNSTNYMIQTSEFTFVILGNGAVHLCSWPRECWIMLFNFNLVVQGTLKPTLVWNSAHYCKFTWI
jgi:hypothetical protein